ncbi:MAG: hypothetical protein IPP60_15345 [Sphingobacteriales bacterium]|nr:hypothetical protein [Sphingobacteriales bacterium]
MQYLYRYRCSLSSPTAGTGSDSCIDDYIWLINGSSQGAYALGSNVGSGAVAGDITNYTRTQSKLYPEQGVLHHLILH